MCNWFQPASSGHHGRTDSLVRYRSWIIVASCESAKKNRDLYAHITRRGQVYLSVYPLIAINLFERLVVFFHEAISQADNYLTMYYTQSRKVHKIISKANV